MKKSLFKSAVLFSSLLVSTLLTSTANASSASASSIVFAEDSYCGNFAGDIYNGKRFKLWLMPKQELVIRNKGGDQVNVAYVDGPNGRLEGDHHNTYSAYYTQANGTHYIKVYGTSHYSSVDFCAY